MPNGLSQPAMPGETVGTAAGLTFDRADRQSFDEILLEHRGTAAAPSSSFRLIILPCEILLGLQLIIGHGAKMKIQLNVTKITFL